MPLAPNNRLDPNLMQAAEFRLYPTQSQETMCLAKASHAESSNDSTTTCRAHSAARQSVTQSTWYNDTSFAALKMHFGRHPGPEVVVEYYDPRTAMMNQTLDRNDNKSGD